MSAPAPSDLLGTLVAGRYRLEELVARGGMGAIYRATQEPLGREVAVKVLVPGHAGVDVRGIDRERFFREASVASRLTHPNTVVIHDYGELDGRPGYYLVMEYLRGKTLADVIEEGPLPLPRVIHIATQVCGALTEAHTAEVVHRDLKPQNIMLIDRAGDEAFVKVVDFGLVKMVDPGERQGEQTEEGIIIGSPLYMAPEQIFSREVDQRTDIYAVGILLYEALCGRPPFVKQPGSSGLQHVIVGHTTLAPPPFDHANPGMAVNDAVEAVVMKCLQKQRQDRYPTARVLADALLDASTNLTDTVRERAEATLDWSAGLELKKKIDQLTLSGQLDTAALIDPSAAAIAPTPAPTTQPRATRPLPAASVLPTGDGPPQPPQPPPPPPETEQQAAPARPPEAPVATAIESPARRAAPWIAAAAATAVAITLGVVAWAPWAGEAQPPAASAGLGNDRPAADTMGSVGTPTQRAAGAAPVAARPPADPQVSIRVESQPAARVMDFMKEKSFGETPRTLIFTRSALPLTLYFERAGFGTVERRVTPAMVGADLSVTLTVVLEKLPDTPPAP